MEIKAVRGMHDLLGDELARWKAAETTIERVLSDFNYEEIRTPVLESVEVFSQAVGADTDIVEKQMYQIQDRAQPDKGPGEKLVLRPEATASVVRAILQHQLHRIPSAQRYYYRMPMFRYERPQKGRLRQFHQIGAELIQDASPEADAESIIVLDTIYRALGLSAYRIGLNSVGSEACRPAYRKALQDFLRPKLESLCELCRKRFERAPMRVLDCKNPDCQKQCEGAPKMVDYLDPESEAHFKAVQLRLQQTGIRFELDPGIVRGLDYYSRTAFEFTSDQLGAQSALGGGGRYDELAARFGAEPFPAVGWALGMERLMMALEASGVAPQIRRGPDYYCIALGEAAFERMFALSVQLRQAGIRIEMSYEKDKKLKWQMKQADRVGARYALLVGDDELASGRAVLKEMATGSQSHVDLMALHSELSGRSGK